MERADESLEFQPPDDPTTGVVAGGVAVTAKGEVAGGDTNLERKTRAGRKKLVVIDGVRTVIFYRLNAHELEYVTAPHKEAGRAGAIFAFCLALLLQIAFSFVFGKAEDDFLRGVAVATAMAALLGALVSVVFWIRYSRQAKSRLQVIKDEHDFP